MAAPRVGMKIKPCTNLASKFSPPLTYCRRCRRRRHLAGPCIVFVDVLPLPIVRYAGGIQLPNADMPGCCVAQHAQAARSCRHTRGLDCDYCDGLTSQKGVPSPGPTVCPSAMSPPSDPLSLLGPYPSPAPRPTVPVRAVLPRTLCPRAVSPPGPSVPGPYPRSSYLSARRRPTARPCSALGAPGRRRAGAAPCSLPRTRACAACRS